MEYLKKVTKDYCDLLFNWANDELVRNSSFNLGKISYEEHRKWLNNKLNSTNCLMYIFYIDEIPIGQVRIDIDNEEAVISYSLDKSYREKGFGKRILQLLENEIYKNNIDIKKLVGYVKNNNIVSQKIFERLNYLKINEGDKLKYYKYI